jgi:hypothetical protein
MAVLYLLLGQGREALGEHRAAGDGLGEAESANAAAERSGAVVEVEQN